MAETIVSPIIKEAIDFYNKYAFFYLYPNVFTIKVDGTNVIRFGVRPIGLPVLPWLLSLVFVTTVAGLGSCVFLCVSPLLQLSLNLHLYHIILLGAFAIAATLEIFLIGLLLKYKWTIQAINVIFHLDADCK